MPNTPEPLIPPHGGYRKLLSFQLAQLTFDITVRFCDKYINPYSRTKDQMVQAARSGVQNIAEGSQVSGTSKKTELRLTNVARGSLEELRRDYEDFLRQSGLEQWPMADRRRKSLTARRPKTADEVAAWIVEEFGRWENAEGVNGRNGHDGLHGHDGHSAQSVRSYGVRPGKSPYGGWAANAALALIEVACSLLDRQIVAQAKAFETEGGFTERLYRTRNAHRRKDS